MLTALALLVQMQGPPCIASSQISAIIKDNLLKTTYIMTDNDDDRWALIEHPNDGSAILGYFQKTTGAFCIATRRRPRTGA